MTSYQYQSTGGNPFLLSQLVDALQGAAAHEAIPPSPLAIIEHRLSHLSQEELRILRAVSVFPDWVSIDLLMFVLSAELLPLTQLCDQLCQKHLLAEEVHDKQLSYCFPYERIRSTVIHQLSESYRRTIHLRAVQYMESLVPSPQLHRLIIHHCSAGGDRYKLFKHQVLLLSSSTELFLDLLPVLSDPFEQPIPDTKNISAQFSALSHELHHLRALQLASSAELDLLECTLLHTAARYYIHNGDYTDGLPLLSQLLERSQAAGDTRSIISARLQYVYYGIQVYDTEVMGVHLSEIAALRPQFVGTEAWGSYLRLTGLLALMRGQYASARHFFSQALDTFFDLEAEASGKYAILIAGIYSYIAESYRLEANFDAAFSYYDRALVQNRSNGLYPGVAVFYTNYGVAAFQSGHLSEARKMFEYADDVYHASYAYSERPIALSYLAYFDALDQKYSLACSRLKEAQEIALKIGSPWWMGVTLYIVWRIYILPKDTASSPLAELWICGEYELICAALSYLRKIEPRAETWELEQRLAELDRALLASKS